MAFIISDFLDVSRLQTGKFEMQKTPTHLDEILNSEIDQLKVTADAHDIKLIYEPPTDLPIINCDQNKIRQVMMNMIDNAIFYSRVDKRIEISLYQKDRGNIVFMVRDYGIGVPHAEQHKLFEKFFRASNARQARPDGTGVGLYMARKIIVAHEGSIIFESRENVGSIFGFRLPVGTKD
jgi:signal transduction histidine kinase